jgi:hypothetical protein
LDWYQRERPLCGFNHFVVFPVAPLRPCCAHTRQSKRPLFIQIVHSRICNNLLSSLFIYSFALSSVEDCWGNRKLTGVNLLKNRGKLTLKHCRNWQRDSFDYACTKDLTSMEWAKSLMMTSCDVLLVDRIDKKFDELDLYEQCGVTYIKVALDEMFTISNTVVTTLQRFFEAFSKDGIA